MKEFGPTVEELPADLGGLKPPFWPGITSTRRCGLPRLWDTKPQITFIRIGLERILPERRSCPICYGPVQTVEP